MQSTEHHLTLAEASRIVPGNPHPSAIWRWCRKGVASRAGERVYLEHRRYGSRIFTSAEALDRFADALAAADREHFDQPAPDQQAQRPRRDRDEAVERAERECDAAGA